MKRSILAIALALLIGAPAAQADVGQTSDGAVRGLSRTNYDAWIGIPYEQQPVGERRFKEPASVQRWSGARDTTHFGGRCTQNADLDPGYEQSIYNEDCLYLNVYAPHTRGKHPVLVWIHGGGFTGGAGQDTDPRKYVDETGAVFVTINYRLGALGFLNVPQLRKEGDGAGAFGLLDQQAALRWVRENIDRFGGDARNVTIAGQSAGGSSVCNQLASPSARKLFDRAIIVSGSCSMVAQDAADTTGQALLKAVGCESDTVNCLRSRTPQQLLAAQTGIRPSVGSSAFPTDPAIAVPKGQINRVPVISGQVHDERTLFAFQDYDYKGTPVMPAQYETLIRSTWGANADKVLAAYPVSAYPSPSAALAAVNTDSQAYTRRQVQTALAQYTPTYVYQFDE